MTTGGSPGPPGSFEAAGDSWWLANDSASSMLYLQGDRGFRADMPPGMRMPLQQWHAKVRVDGVTPATRSGCGCRTWTTRTTTRLDEPEPPSRHAVTAERIVTSTPAAGPAQR